MQGNARGTYECGCKVPGERRGMQGDSGEYRGMPGERLEVGEKCQGKAGECRGTPGERMGVGVNCQGKAGMQGNIRGTHGSGCLVPGECRGLPGEWELG